ncbi:uncharacterized protein LOC142560008 isoform X1 [Dermacentor variabilis]|uniref:uncharacterized protein LOC142560008 isoform X1 n=1 Tax=Dermacentor variabilis TaxID=34621 RepID=UPI003F5BF6BB
MARSTGICPTQEGVLLVASRKLAPCFVSSPPGVLLASSPRIPAGFPAFAPDSRRGDGTRAHDGPAVWHFSCPWTIAVAEDAHHPTGLQCDRTPTEYIRLMFANRGKT